MLAARASPFRTVWQSALFAHEEAQDHTLLKIHSDTFSGHPTREELGLLNWRPGRWGVLVSPAMPMLGSIADQHQALSRRILHTYGFEYITEYVCGPRLSRALHIIIFNRQDLRNANV